MRLDVKRRMDEGDVAAIAGLLDAAEAADGHPPLGEHQWLDLVQAGGDGFAGVVGWDGDRPTAYAQVRRHDGHWALELVVDPALRDSLVAVGPPLVDAALDVVAASGGGRVRLWVSRPRVDHDRLAEVCGLARERTLFQMRRPLPVGLPVDLATRPFEPGRDEEAWLEVNNAAFAGHPEQGGWTVDTLLAREKEPWFDPAGFLLHERDGRLAGFCWTKIHLEHRPAVGEIYVIAVAPEVARHGLGRQLVLAGLQWLAQRGLSIGMLYVDSANQPAISLYRDLGFAVDHVDAAYARDVDP